MKYLRHVFWIFWFVLVPAALAWAAVSVLDPGPEQGRGLLATLRWFVREQPLPAGIVLFTFFEFLLYHYRYSLPLAVSATVGGRSDIPAEHRREFEHAGRLLEEARRIFRKHQSNVERHVPRKQRDELSSALKELQRSLDQQPFDPQAFRAVHTSAQHNVSRYLGRWQKSEFREYVESIAIAVAVAMLLRAVVIEAFKIPSGSMLPTLQIQDHIFVNKLSYGPLIPFTKTRIAASLPPARGDVIVFEKPDVRPGESADNYIKRVIAIAGDTLEVHDGHPIINGWQVPHCRVGNYRFRESGADAGKSAELFVEFLGEYSYLTIYEQSPFTDGTRKQGPYYVKPGETWVLGDARNNSQDSRAWFNNEGGGVPDGNIKGRAMFVWLSFDISGSITWNRLFTNVMGRPRLPDGADRSIVEGVERCLAQRPAVTTPPKPR